MKFLKKYRLRSLLGKLMVSHFVVVVITLLIMGVLLTYLLENYFFGAREWELTAQARDAAYLLEKDFHQGDLQEVEKTAETLAYSLDSTIRVIDDQGDLLSVTKPDDEEDSETTELEDPQKEEVELEESEIEHVLEGNMLTKKIYGPQMQRLMVAAPIKEIDEEEEEEREEEEEELRERHEEEADLEEEEEGEEEEEEETENQNSAEEGNHNPSNNSSNHPSNNPSGGEESEEEPPEVIGMVTLSAPLLGVEETITQISQLILYSGFIGVLAAGLLAFSLAKKLTNPIQKINRAALDLAAGNFRQKVDLDTGSQDEIGNLAHTFNYSVEQVERTIEEQNRLEEFRRQLIANVSHELKAPLSSMQGYAELMLDGLIQEEDREKYLKIILDNSVHLSRLVEDLMNLSRLECGQQTLDRELISPLDPARLSVDSIKPKAQQKGVELNFSVPQNQELPPIHADANRIHEVLTNILENAVDYSPPGEEVNLTMYLQDQNVVYEVVDRGTGIPAEDLEHIWERFYKVDKSRQREDGGSGLGLAIVKQLVEMHGGWVEANSELDKGSIFRVYLPRADR